MNELKWSDDDIVQLRGAINHLLEINEEQNARLIAMNAKLQNEEAKVRKLTMTLNYITNNHDY